MQLPLVAPAPIFPQPAGFFRELFENRCQFYHFQHYLTGLMVLENNSLSNISRFVVDSADKTNLSRFLSKALWEAKHVNARRLGYMSKQTQAQQRPAQVSCLVVDDRLCIHLGSLVEYVDRHYDHAEHQYPVAHKLNQTTKHWNTLENFFLTAETQRFRRGFAEVVLVPLCSSSAKPLRLCGEEFVQIICGPI